MSFTLIVLVMLLVVFILAVMVAFMLKKASEHKSKEFIQKEQQTMRDALVKRRKQLQVSKKNMYQHITDAMTFEAEDAVTYLKITGLIYNENRKPVVAFERIERGMYEKGHLIAVTKKQEFLCEFHGLDVLFYVDSEPFGRIDQKGQIFDSHEQLIGKAAHPLGVNLSIDAFKKSLDRQENKSFPLILNGRELATINLAPNYSEISPKTTVAEVFDTYDLGSKVLSLSDTPTDNEAIWLLIFAIFEITYHGKKLIS